MMRAKLAHIDPRAGLPRSAESGRYGSAHIAAFDLDFMRIARRRAARDRDPCDCADGRQRFAAKSQRCDIRKVVMAFAADR